MLKARPRTRPGAALPSPSLPKNSAGRTTSRHATAIEMLPLNALQPYENNARKHDDRQLRKLAKVIDDIGFQVPILIDEDNIIIAGHARYEAVKLLGMEQVPTIRIAHLQPAQVKAFRLAENKLHDLSSFDEGALALELKALSDLDLELLDLTAFETAEIDLSLELLEEKLRDDPADAVCDPQPELTTSQLGDVWLFGEHRLVCGSALDEGAYMAALGSRRAQATFTDPPFNVRVDGHVGGSGRIKHREFVQGSGEMSEAAFVAFLTSFLILTARFCVDGALVYGCMDAVHTFELLLAARQAGLKHKSTCTWAKTNAGMGGLYRVQTEFVHVFKAGNGAHQNNVQLGRFGRSRTTLWTYAGVNTFRRGRMDDLAMHPTVKPTALVVDAIKDCTRRGDIVLDPFAGSGTTLLAAERTGRVGCGIELDPIYCDVAVRRLEAVTKKTAVHEGTGLTFSALAEQRQSQIAATAHAAADKHPAEVARG